MNVVGAIFAVLIATVAVVYYRQMSTFRNILTEKVDDEYDYIVVGGGSAGSVVAARLSEDKENRVLLLEAGGFFDESSHFHVPLLWPLLMHTEYDWEYYTEPMTEASLSLKQRRSYWPRGRVLGGSSVINGAQYTRGSRFDFDQWAANGCTGWNYKDVLPYFLKSEDILIPELKSSKYHNSGGPLGVSSSGVTKLAELCLKAGEELGYDITDYNGEEQQGFSMAQLTVRNGVKSSIGLEFLGESKKLENLDIVIRSFVTNIDIRNKKAVGVFFIRNGRKQYVKAKKEIIVSAGAINSPQLLMLSGIGPKDHLKQLNIPVVADLPVGKNLQDHVMVMMFTSINKPYSNTADIVLSWRSLLQYYLLGSGPLANSGLAGSAFLHLNKTTKGKDSPDIQVMFQNAYVSTNIFNVDDEVAKEYFSNDPNKHGFGMAICLSHPISRGTIRLTSKDPFDHPIIDARYLTEKQDVNQLIGGIRIWEKVLETKTMKDVRADINLMKLSICSEYNFRSDAYWECFIRHLGLTIYHYSGTCKMGSEKDSTAVVNPQLQVRGIQGLRVVDASVFPNVTSGNTNAPVIMVAEKAADMIRGKNTVAHLVRKL